MRIRTAIVPLVLAATTVMAGAPLASADANAVGNASYSPGFLSGNVVQIPINIPINICGNSINILAALNPTGGNLCINR